MAQVWSSSTVHFMVQDPLKAIICKVLNRKMCIFFSRSTWRREAGLLNPILCEKWSHSHLWPPSSWGYGWSWRTKRKMSSVSPSQEFFSTRTWLSLEKAVNLPLRRHRWDFDRELTLLYSPFSAYFFLLVAWSPRYEHGYWKDSLILHHYLMIFLPLGQLEF